MRSYGVIESMGLDRVNFVLTLRVRFHPRRADQVTVVERFETLQAMLDRYDALVAEEMRGGDDPVFIGYDDSGFTINEMPNRLILSSDKALSAADLDRFREEVRRKYYGADNAGRPMTFNTVGAGYDALYVGFLNDTLGEWLSRFNADGSFKDEHRWSFGGDSREAFRPRRLVIAPAPKSWWRRWLDRINNPLSGWRP